MGTAIYDKAIMDKLKRWTEGTNVTVVSPEDTRTLFEVTADRKNDKPIQLPMICLRRATTYTLDGKAGKSPLTFDAVTTEATIARSTKINAIPIRLSYQIDIYTRFYEEADEYMRNLVFNLYNYPAFEVQLPYEGKGYTHTASMVVNPTISNNSSTQERLAVGQFTKLSVGFDVKDAYLFDVRTKDNYSIGVRIWTINPDGTNDSQSYFQTEEV